MNSQEIIGIMQGIGWSNEHPLLKSWLGRTPEEIQEYDSTETWCCGVHATVEVVKGEICIIIQEYCHKGRGRDKATVLWREDGSSVELYKVPAYRWYGPVDNPQMAYCS